MKLLRPYLLAVPFLAGGYLGYTSPSIATSDALTAAAVGAFIGMWAGAHILVALSPRDTIVYLTQRGLERGAAPFIPVAGICTSCGVYYLFRDLLNAPDIWRPVIVVVVASGIIALFRIKVSGAPE